MKFKKYANKRGVAVILVLMVSAALLALITVLVFNTRNQKSDFEFDYDRTKASLAAKAALQLAIYKFRVLPTEFYKIHELALKAGSSSSGSATQNSFKKSLNIWLSDLQSATPGAPSQKILSYLNGNNEASGKFSFGIDEFRIVSQGDKSYVRDYVKIRAWGKYGKAKQVLEELIEIQIAKE